MTRCSNLPRNIIHTLHGAGMSYTFFHACFNFMLYSSQVMYISFIKTRREVFFIAEQLTPSNAQTVSGRDFVSCISCAIYTNNCFVVGSFQYIHKRKEKKSGCFWKRFTIAVRSDALPENQQPWSQGHEPTAAAATAAIQRAVTQYQPWTKKTSSKTTSTHNIKLNSCSHLQIKPQPSLPVTWRGRCPFAPRIVKK